MIIFKDKKLRDTKRALLDRRSEFDRRNVYDLDYFQTDGKERRKLNNRRSTSERRAGWLRINKWLSVNIQDLRTRCSEKV